MLNQCKVLRKLKVFKIIGLIVLLVHCGSYTSQIEAAIHLPSNPKPNQNAQASTLTLKPVTPESPKKRIIKILSIDGGGVRGIIPSLVLENLESRLPRGHRLAEHFDIIAGTSAGGILAFLLATPDAAGKPKYSTPFITSEISAISQQTFTRSLWQIIKSGDGWFDAKYDGRPLQNKLKDYFENTKLSHLVTNVIVPAYDIEKDKTYFFKASRARNEPLQDYYVRDLAYATAAAPTYFRPAQIKDTSEKLTLTLIDGGVSANNPTLAAIVHAVELYGTDVEFFVVSIGTGTNFGAEDKKVAFHEVQKSGKLGWISKIVSLLMYTATSLTDYEAYYVLNYKKPQTYFRLQVTLEPKHADIDNITPHNIAALKNYANQIIQQYDAELSNIVRALESKHEIRFREEKTRQAFH